VKELYSIEKAIQVLSYMQKGTSENNYTLLLKYLFFADRYSIRKYAMPVLGEPRYYAMRRGPVASNTLDVLKKNVDRLPNITAQEKSMLDAYIQRPDMYTVKIDTFDEYDLLSKADIESLDFVIDHFKGLSFGNMIELTHQYPEWARVEQELTSGQKRVAMNYEDFFDNPEAEHLQKIQRILHSDDPFTTAGPGAADLALAKDVYLNC
jgi:hypothetical protein